MEKKFKLSPVFRESQQIISVMRLTAVLLIVFFIQAQALGMAQTVSMSGKNITLRQIFGSIKKQTGYVVIGKKEIFYSAKPVSLSLSNTPLKQALNEVLKDQQLEYTIQGRTIMLSAKVSPITAPKVKKMLLWPEQLSAITGDVRDADGAPVPSANIQIKGSMKGVSANASGHFTISGINQEDILVISAIGYSTLEISYAKVKALDEGQEIFINDSKVIKSGTDSFVFYLATQVSRLDEVQIISIGYGTVKKKDLTGSVSSIGSGDLNTGVNAALTSAIQGKAAGVNILPNSGQPGANAVVRIRGGTSITAGNNPLYVIDGVPVAFSEDSYTSAANPNFAQVMTKSASNPLNMINPSDIESVDILKDASATAIYGSRGANGVILITTKQGKKGKNTIDIDMYGSVSSLRKKLPILSADEYRAALKAHPEVKNWNDYGASTDWQDEIFRDAPSQSYDVSMTGGNSQTNYRASINYFDQKGIIISSGMNKLTGRVNISHTFSDRLKMSFNLANVLENHDNVPNPETSGSDAYTGVIKDALRFNPTSPVREADGKFAEYSIFLNNPVAEATQIQDKTDIKRMLGNITADLKLTDYLTFRVNAGITEENVFRGTYMPKSILLGAQYNGSATQQTNHSSSKLLETNFNFNKAIGINHVVSGVLGYSFQDFAYRNLFTQSQNFISDATSYNDLDAGTVFYAPISGKYGNTLISFFGRANYNLSQKYLLTATVRRDGSSRFGANNKWGVFPSAAFAWRIIEENFLKNNSAISDLKLRLSYGVTGNQDIGNYISIPTLSAGTQRYMFGNKIITAIGANQYSNPDIKWESTAQSNIGVDFGFLKNRVTGTIDLYYKKTSDLLLNFSLPSPSEVNSTVANVGSIENRGIELALNARVLDNGMFKWNIYGNFSRNRNKVLSLSNDKWFAKDIATDREPNGGSTTQIIRVGDPFGTYYGKKYLGPDENGKESYLDENQDGIPDLVIIGKSQPDFFYGFGTNLSYGGFKLDVFLRGVEGVDLYNATAQENRLITKLPMNILKSALDDGLVFGATPNIYSSKYIEDASFLRLENVQLNYNIKAGNAKWIKKASIYISGQNLFVITKYTGYDPEVSRGVDYNVYPRPRIISLGTQLQF